MKINKPVYLIVHHCGGSDLDPMADSSNQTFEVVNEYHHNNPRVWLGEYSSLGFAIGYHYFIDKTGKITQGRADTDEGAHTVGYNTQSLGICMAGNFDATMPTYAQIASLKAILSHKMVEYNIPISRVVPHRHFANKSCYGHNLSDSWLEEILSKELSPITPCNAEKDTIELQKKQISNLQSLINTLIAFFKNK